MNGNNPAKEVNGWDVWAVWVKKSITELKDEVHLINEKMDGIAVATAVLKVKSGMWGAIGGAIPVLVLVILYMVFKK